jgi:hypothetical protein
MKFGKVLSEGTGEVTWDLKTFRLKSLETTLSRVYARRSVAPKRKIRRM